MGRVTSSLAALAIIAAALGTANAFTKCQRAGRVLYTQDLYCPTGFASVASTAIGTVSTIGKSEGVRRQEQEFLDAREHSSLGVAELYRSYHARAGPVASRSMRCACRSSQDGRSFDAAPKPLVVARQPAPAAPRDPRPTVPDGMLGFPKSGYRQVTGRTWKQAGPKTSQRVAAALVRLHAAATLLATGGKRWATRFSYPGNWCRACTNARLGAQRTDADGLARIKRAADEHDGRCLSTAHHGTGAGAVGVGGGCRRAFVPSHAWPRCLACVLHCGKAGTSLRGGCCCRVPPIRGQTRIRSGRMRATRPQKRPLSSNAISIARSATF